MEYVKKIVIINSEKPKNSNLNEEIQWFSNCLGMFNKRDKEKSCFRIFVNLLKERNPLSSEQIAQRSHLTRATVIHHLSKLINSGIVVEKNKKYVLRDNNLENLIKKIEKDVLFTFKKLKEVSKGIDRELKNQLGR